MAIYSEANAGSPLWWLARLVQRLLDRQPRYDRLERYYLGDHPLPVGDRRFRTALRALQDKCRTNYCCLIADSVVERLHVVGFRFGRTQGEADRDADMIWKANQLDHLSALVHLGAAIFGDTYALVSSPLPGERWPVITQEDPRNAIAEMDPVRHRDVRAGLRMWVDDVDQLARAEVYTLEWSAYFTAPHKVPDDWDRYCDQPRMLRRFYGDAHNWELVAVVPNTIGVVPLVRFQWRPAWGAESWGEFEPILAIQDRINATVLDRMIISRAQAYKQRWARGITIKQGDDGRARPPFDPGADILWATESETAQFGEFREADIRQVLEAVRHDVQDLAAVSKTPPHYLIGEVVNASGDALKAAETGLVSKAKERMRSMGQSWAKTQQIAFAQLGDTDRASTVDVEALWADPESRSRAELADAALKESTIGVPFSILMERLQYTPNQIERARVERNAEEMRALTKMVQQQKMLAAIPKQQQVSTDGG